MYTFAVLAAVAMAAIHTHMLRLLCHIVLVDLLPQVEKIKMSKDELEAYNEFYADKMGEGGMPVKEKDIMFWEQEWEKEKERQKEKEREKEFGDVAETQVQ